MFKFSLLIFLDVERQVSIPALGVVTTSYIAKGAVLTNSLIILLNNFFLDHPSQAVIRKSQRILQNLAALSTHLTDLVKNEWSRMYLNF